MRKLKTYLKYAAIVLVVISLAAVAFATNFVYRSKAPVISGNVEYGIPYKDELKLDVYKPTRERFERSPVILYVHGGAWIGGTRSAINFNRYHGAINTLRSNGYTIICPDYSLAGETESVFPQCILDVYDAIEWTKDNAALYNLDTTNIGLFGESAGAHIAMMIAFSEKPLEGKHAKTKFNYLVDVAGPNDLTDIYHGQALEKIDASVRRVSRIFGSEFNIKEYVFGFDPSQDSIRASQLMDTFSPINLVTENTTPMLIIHGKVDRIVPVTQSQNLKAKLDELQIKSEIHVLDSVDHNFIHATRAQMDSTQIWIADFVLRHYSN